MSITLLRRQQKVLAVLAALLLIECQALLEQTREVLVCCHPCGLRFAVTVWPALESRREAADVAGTRLGLPALAAAAVLDKQFKAMLPPS